MLAPNLVFSPSIAQSIIDKNNGTDKGSPCLITRLTQIGSKISPCFFEQIVDPVYKVLI